MWPIPQENADVVRMQRKMQNSKKLILIDILFLDIIVHQKKTQLLVFEFMFTHLLHKESSIPSVNLAACYITGQWSEFRID